MPAVRHLTRRQLLVALLTTAGAALALAPAAQQTVNVGRRALAAHPPAGERIVGRDGPLPFIVGVNYEGPADRAWAMWSDKEFDPDLIAIDFARAADFRFNSLRLFVQRDLILDIKRGDWDKLDEVIALAREYRLRLLLTLGDYDETQLAILGRDAARIAARYAGHPAILAYDVRNEPQLKDLLIARYPGYPNVPPLPLQGSVLLEMYGEHVTREEVAARRAADPFWLPTRLTSDEAYWYANSLAVYTRLHAEAAEWLRDRPGHTILDYLAEPEPAERWAALLALINQALETWLAALIEPIRRADPACLLTLGHNDLLLASLPANAMLDFVSFHHYPSPEDTAPELSARTLGLLARRQGKPGLLSEFGWPTHETPPERVGQLEAATLRALREHGLAGGLKWMLNDVAGAEDTREGSFGLFTADGTPKASAVALRSLA